VNSVFQIGFMRGRRVMHPGAMQPDVAHYARGRQKQRSDRNQQSNHEPTHRVQTSQAYQRGPRFQHIFRLAPRSLDGVRMLRFMCNDLRFAQAALQPLQVGMAA
jgi:hypothetical protein